MPSSFFPRSNFFHYKKIIIIAKRREETEFRAGFMLKDNQAVDFDYNKIKPQKQNTASIL